MKKISVILAIINLISLIYLVFNNQLKAGTNTLTTRSGGQIIQAADVNQYKTALGSDLVPRNTSGVPTDSGGNLGTSTYRFNVANIVALAFGSTAYSNGLTEGASGNITLRGEGKINFNISGTVRGYVDANGFSGNDIADGTVRREELESVGQVSGNESNASITSTSYTDWLDSGAAAVTITVNTTGTGRPVMLMLDAYSTSAAYIKMDNTGDNTQVTCQGTFKIIRNGSTIKQLTFGAGQSAADGANTLEHYIVPSSIWTLDAPSAGSNVYTFQVKVSPSGCKMTFNSVTAVGWEL